jgi:hypothetical protein
LDVDAALRAGPQGAANIDCLATGVPAFFLLLLLLLLLGQDHDIALPALSIAWHVAMHMLNLHQ